MPKHTLLFLALSLAACRHDPEPADSAPRQCDPLDSGPIPMVDAFVPPMPVDPAVMNGTRLINEGRETFRSDTFGDEAFWGDTLQLHRSIAGEANGGVGPGLTPATALSLGLKVDVDALPAELQGQIARGEVDLADPAVTLALLRINSVVGVTGFFTGDNLTSIGIQCAFCHSTVDDSFAPSIGHRLDGWPNRDLDVGKIVAFAPNLAPVATLLGIDEATVRTVLMAWGPGRYDAELLIDGRALRPDGQPGTTVLPPAFGLAGVNMHTYTGWGSVTYWNAYVANTQMHGAGTFYDPRLNDATQFPIAAANGMGNMRAENDRITPRLAGLQLYQLSLPIPTPPASRFDAAAAERGRAVFNGAAQCATCHVPPLYSEPGWNMHTPEEIGIDDFQASRSPDGHYRTTPLGGLFTRERGGFYHDGRFATLDAVVDHYDDHFDLGLSAEQHADLVQFLRSL